MRRETKTARRERTINIESGRGGKERSSENECEGERRGREREEEI